MYYKLILNFFLGSGSGSSPSRCTDSSRNCRNWATQGYCSYNLYTKTNCKKSCNLCREWLCNIHLFIFLIVNANFTSLSDKEPESAPWTLVWKKTLSSTFKTPFFGSLREQPTFRDATGFPAKWHLRNDYRNSILMTRHYPELGSASDWLRQIFRQSHAKTQTWLVSHHQYGISALIFQAPFYGDTSGGVTKCRIFSQVIILVLPKFLVLPKLLL